LSSVDAALEALSNAADDFEGPNGYGKPNQPLIDATIEAERVRAELAVAESKLAEIKARGDSVQRLTDAVRSAETQLQSLVSKAESAEILRLAHVHYGWSIGWDRVSSENKRDFQNHASVIAFKEFYAPRALVHPGQTLTVQALQAQLQLIGEKLTALRDHLSEE
jgi:hypothetical protein